MMISRAKSLIGLCVFLTALCCAACGGASEDGDGGGGIAVGKQYTLDVEGSITITEIGPAASTIAKDTPQPQVMIGTVFAEVTSIDSYEIGLKLFDLDLKHQDALGMEITLEVTPHVTSIASISQMDEFGEPYFQSYIDMDFVVRRTNGMEFLEGANTLILDDGALLHLGGLQAVMDEEDESRIPFINDLPAIGFLFNEKHYEAKCEQLLISLTPEIIQDLP